jgi:glycerophosphoryl diester phosphodiesterase
MRHALDVGKANALEFDVHLSRDKELVVAHDRRLGRVSQAKGWNRWIRLLPLSRLRKVNAAYWWVEGEVADHHAAAEKYTLRDQFPGDPSLGIPTAAEVLEASGGVPLTIEVKSFRAARPLVELLQQRGRQDVTVTAFFTPILWRVRQARGADRTIGLSPATAYTLWFRIRSWLPGRPRRSSYARIQIPVRKFGVTFATPRFVAAAHQAGLKVDVWTIDDAPTMKRLRKMGVDGIMTDRPSRLADVMSAE